MNRIRILKRQEMDRPTHNSLKYLTKVQPHHLQRENFLVDPYVYETLQEFLDVDSIDEFDRYTRSFYSLEGHYENLWNYDRVIEPKPDDPLLEQAIQITNDAFKLKRPVETINWHQLKAVPYIPSSSAGWGFIGPKGAPGNIDLAVSKAVLSLNMWLEDIRDGTSHFRFHPDLAWTRTQMGTYDNPKVRCVWGTSFDNIILEGLTAAPLINAYREQIDGPIAIGSNYFRQLPRMINSCLFDGEKQYYGVGIDYKRFDSSIQPWLIEECFNIFENNLIFTGEYEKASFDYTKHFFVHRPLVMPDGRMWLKHLGIPSGSYWTQLIGSAANHIATTYGQLHVYGRHEPTKTLGDDSLFRVPVEFGKPNLDDFRNVISRLGLTVHPEKGCVASRASELEFLGHCAYGTRIDRETADMLRLALYPEHPVHGPAHALSRIKGILLDSALNSWPIIHLHDLMMIKFKDIQFEPIDFTGADSSWFKAVLDIKVQPKDIDTFRVFTLT